MITRFCITKGHEGEDSKYVCTFRDCEVGNRGVCSECLIEQLHNHGLKKQDHIMKQQQFIEFVTKQSELCENSKELQTLQELHKELEQLIFSTILLKNQVMNSINQLNTLHLQNIINVAKQDYLLLDNEQIQSLILMNNIKYDNKLTNDVVLQIRQQNQEINILINMNNESDQQILPKQKQSKIRIMKQQIVESQQYSNQNNQQLKQQERQDSNHLVNKQNFQDSNQNYQVQFQQQQKHQQFKGSDIKILELQRSQCYQSYIEYTSDFSIKFSQISCDEQYLGIVGFDKKIQIFDLNTDQKLLCFYSQNQVNKCIFTLDSLQLLCIDDEGFLQQFDVKQFKLLNSNKIHENSISDIIFINNNEIITCSADQSIQIRNIFSNQQAQVIKNAHNDFIYGLDYDYQKEIIFSCSKDNSIKLFDKKSGRLIIEQGTLNQCDIQQIYVIPFKNAMISSSDSYITLWQINYDRKQLIKIKLLSELNYNCTSVLQNTHLVLICENQVKILDNDLNLMNIFQHEIRDLCNLFLQISLFQDQSIRFNELFDHSRILKNSDFQKILKVLTISQQGKQIEQFLYMIIYLQMEQQEFLKYIKSNVEKINISVFDYILIQ